MNEKTTKTLSWIGIGIVILSLFLLVLPMMASEKINAVASTLALGIGLLVLAQIGPFIKSIKGSGMEVEFIDTFSDRYNLLHQRLADLELVERHKRHPPLVEPPAVRPKAPGCSEPILYENDPHRGRFGGKASAAGFTLSGHVRHVGRDFAEVRLVVTTNRDDLNDADCVEFYLPKWFKPDEIPAVFQEREAAFNVIVHRRFTVGAWVGCTGTQLELDIADVVGVPRSLRES